jgi:divalent metal cation (Fe/Co/Zn/Cd) transporter
VSAAVADLQAGAPGDEEVDEDLNIVIAIALCSIVIFSFLTYLKLYYARVLNSESLHKDGLCSVIGLLLSLLIFTNSWLISSRPEFWKLDPYLAIACGGIAISIGSHGMFRAIFTKKLSILSLSFWRGEQVASVPADIEQNSLKLSEVV